MATMLDDRPSPSRSGADRVPVPAAIGLGVLAVGAALAVGDLVAGLVSPSSSPFLAVGAQFIRLTPEWLKEFATSTFGTADKLVLLIGMAAVLVVLAAVAGVLSRRQPGPGVAVVTLLGAAGVASVLAAPTFAPLDLLAPAAAIVAGVAVLRWLQPLALEWARTRDTDGPGGGVARRRLLVGAGGAVVGIGAAGVFGRLLGGGGAEASRDAVGALPPAGPAPAPPVNADFAALGTPTWLTPAADFYRIDTALQIPQIATGDYSLRIHGMVERELTLSYDQLRARRLIQAPITMTCVSNDVGGDLISNAVFTGVPLRDLLAEAGVRPGADQIFSTSSDGWTSGTPVDAVTDGRDAMLAIGMNGAPLPLEHGFPVRMVVPGLYGFVSGCKWITDMELTRFGDEIPYWEQRGWGRRGPIKTQSRIDVPRSGAVLPAGPTTLAGIAWAQHTGVARVEVRADDGPWRDAQLADEVGTDTWRMWRATLDLSQGRHQLQVRATDRTGYTQTPAFSLTIPDGATGWHTIDMTSR